MSILRVMDEQIVRARDTLVDPSLSAEKRVHEARKRFKETRALIRLVREPLGGHYAHENAWFRDAGREMAFARDADATLEALEKLDLPQSVARAARETLESRREAHPPLEPVIANVVDQLVVAQGRLGMWPRFHDSFDTIAGGLLRAYGHGRRDFRNHWTDEELHDWRKRVKEHWYHMQLLRHVWPEVMEPYAGVLSTLSKLLGDHHDLHVLRGMLAEMPPVTEAIDARQGELEREAEAIGARVYAEKPAAWLARMRKYWNAWHRTSR